VDERFTRLHGLRSHGGGVLAASLALIRMRDYEFDLPPLRAASRWSSAVGVVT
jgi:hypothetical protein